MLEITLEDELEHIQSMTINEAVAYANRLICRLNRYDCSDDEKKKGLIILERLSDRARFLKIPTHPA